MFNPQFGLYDQVKQRQSEMERSAQQDLEVLMAQQNTPTTNNRLVSLLDKWFRHLHTAPNPRPTSLTVRP